MNKTSTNLAIGLTTLATVIAIGAVSAAGQPVSTYQRQGHDRTAHGMSHGTRDHTPMGPDHGSMMSRTEITRVMAQPEMRQMHRVMTKAHRDSMGMDMAPGMPMMQMR